jgi:hypothetical protein
VLERLGLQQVLHLVVMGGAHGHRTRARTKGLARTQTAGVLFLGFIPFPALVRDVSEPDISAPSKTFLSGLGRTLGYNVEADGENLSVSFEPWALEHTGPFQVPCLRLHFRQRGDRIVLERFTVSDEGEERTVNLDAAHDALQAWMDWMVD